VLNPAMDPKMVPTNDPDGPPERKQQEHRQHPRTKVPVAVELQSERDSAPLRVKTADLSIGGLYIKMMFTLEIGTKLKIVLWIEDVKVSTGGVVVTSLGMKSKSNCLARRSG
jgi:c-di-GMP-binding flagellar brake protein YcgR